MKLGDATIGAINKDGLFQENLINSLDYNQGNVLVVIVAVNVTERLRLHFTPQQPTLHVKINTSSLPVDDQIKWFPGW